MHYICIILHQKIILNYVVVYVKEHNRHTKSFRDRGNTNEILKYIWQLKDECKSCNLLGYVNVQ